MRMCMLYVTHMGFPYWLFRLWCSSYEGVFGGRCTSAQCRLLPNAVTLSVRLSFPHKSEHCGNGESYAYRIDTMRSSHHQGCEAKIFGLEAS